MKSYHMALGYVVLVIGLSGLIIWNVSTTDVSDCGWYIEDEWTFAPQEARQRAYDECLETPHDERDNPKIPALIIMIGTFIPSGIYAAYKAYSEWKKTLHVTDRRTG